MILRSNCGGIFVEYYGGQVINYSLEGRKKEKKSKKQIRGKGEIADFFFLFLGLKCI